MASHPDRTTVVAFRIGRGLDAPLRALRRLTGARLNDERLEATGLGRSCVSREATDLATKCLTGTRTSRCG